MREYALFYCLQDVRVLAQSLTNFDAMTREHFDLSIFDYLTVSSLGMAYQAKRGAFDGIYFNSGDLRKYLAQFVVGGKTMLANNTAQLALYPEGISDFDGVSLYPSAMNRGYFPAGKPQVMSSDEIEHWNVADNLLGIPEGPEGPTLFALVRLDGC